jgi:hypothetical protein
MNWLRQWSICFSLFVIVLFELTQFAAPAYAQDVSTIDRDEATSIAKIVTISQQLQAPGNRGQHPKSHGTVWAEFTVAPNLPENLRVGIFKQPGKTYPAWIRFSNASATDDTKPGGHGMAIKLMNVAGEKVLKQEKTAATQDFVLLDHPVFFIRNSNDFAEFFTALAEGGSPTKFFATHAQEAATAQAMQQKQIVNPLVSKYWSTTPYQFGDTAVKYAVVPTSPVTGELGTTPNYLRSALSDYLQEQDALFDFLIQVQTDGETTPIEDPTVEWREQDAPLQKVATIRIPRQVFDTAEQNAFDEALSFTPWHSLPEHQPLGSINRARQAVYQATSEQRHQETEAAMEEPTPNSFIPQLLQP